MFSIKANANYSDYLEKAQVLSPWAFWSLGFFIFDINELLIDKGD